MDLKSQVYFSKLSSLALSLPEKFAADKTSFTHRKNMLSFIFLIVSFLSGGVLSQSTSCSRHAPKNGPPLFDFRPCQREVEDSCYTCPLKTNADNNEREQYGCWSMGAFPACQCEDPKSVTSCLNGVEFPDFQNNKDGREMYLKPNCRDNDKCPWDFYPGVLVNDSMIVAINGEDYPAQDGGVDDDEAAEEEDNAGEGGDEAGNEGGGEAGNEGGGEDAGQKQQELGDVVLPGRHVIPLSLTAMTFGRVYYYETYDEKEELQNEFLYDFIDDCKNTDVVFSTNYACGSCRWNTEDGQQPKDETDVVCGEGAWIYPPVFMLAVLTIISLLFV